MSSLTCDEVHEFAAELALGTLPGPERAEVLDHLEHCADCQRHVEELADAADALLLLAPEVAPPAGFAERVAAGLDVPGARRRRLGVAVLGAAAALVLAVGVGTAILASHGTSAGPRQFALGAPGVVMASFTPTPGEHTAGQVFSYAGRPSWVFMTVHDDGSSDTYHCQLELADGHRLDIGTFGLHDGAGSWGRTLALDVHQLRAVHLVDAHGATAATARLS